MIHHLSIITARGQTLSIKASGSAGPPVFLIHGFPLDYRMWSEQIEALAQRFRVIVPELRGFGGSTVDADYALSDLADDIEQVRIHLASKDKIHLIGLSMGGYVAFEYWHRHGTNLRSLVLANTKPDRDSPAAAQNRLDMADHAIRQGTWPAVSPMMDRLIASSSKGTAVEEKMREMMMSASPLAIAAAQRAMANRRDFCSLLSGITTPTLVLTGQLDSIAPPEATQQWASKLPLGKFAEIPAAGHMTTLETPELFNAIVTQFLNEVG